MTDETPRSDPAAQSDQPELRVLAQYVKDLSFENPDAPQSLVDLGKPGSAPQIDISVSVSLRKANAEQFDIELKLSATARRAETTVFVVEVVYGGLFLLRNIPEDNVKPILNIECPRILFPFARRILADAVRDGGFPTLMLDPIDFAGLYHQQLMNERAGAGLGADTQAEGNA